MLKRSDHTPAHLFIDQTPYFITGAIYKKQHLLVHADIKQKLLDFIKTYFAQYQWELHHWVILDNHYHLLGKSAGGTDLPAIFQAIHSCSAKVIRQTTNCAKPVWWNYWDYCPRDETGYMTRLNYLLYNPVRHGYVTDLHQYSFSTFHKLFAEQGRSQLVKQFQDYPDYKKLILTEAEEDDF
ncbi:hypothetical protein U27_04998 [Candidatus Vecturithrix granuli]|uniref:Transposase IS200-like domain-containing protein n=1 Tax=Vecturithrix granuli TaxID=1499967 RepID=A0A081C0C0_VECG1|nr:hypothetical protein U27_04998 [Candidatus Vecturithrix granuli]